MTIFPQCMSCKHLQEGKPPKCTAFPDGIPMPILMDEVDHRKPVEGDHGIQFSPNPGEKSPFDGE